MPIQTTNIDTTGDAFDFTADNETYVVAAGVFVVSESFDGIGCGFSGCEIANYGQLAGHNNGINVNGGFSNQVVNETTGSITSDFNGILINSGGDNNIENDGKISAISAGIADFSGDGNSIYNYGAVTAGSEGIYASSGDFVYNSGQVVSENDGAFINTTSNVRFENVGTTKGGAFSVISGGTGTVGLTNRGVLDGNVSLKESGAATVRNAGAIYGSVRFVNGAANIFDGRGGTVEGTITGGSGADTIHLGSDGETVNGGAGHDVIYGGTGADTFAFNSIKSVNSDQIYGFNVAVDTIQLNHAEFTALTPGATPVFSIASSATSASDHLFYNSSTGSLFYDPDGTGSQSADRIANLGTGLHLTEKSFTVV